METRKEVKLLVVDENETYYAALCDSAEMWSDGFRIECRKADSATAALATISSWCPTVIMVDSHLADMNCLEFIEQLKEREAPLVVASEHLSEETRESVLKHGASAYVGKTEDPDEVEQLLTRIAKLSALPHEALH